jgi:hypothetical protein
MSGKAWWGLALLYAAALLTLLIVIAAGPGL